MTFVIQQHHDGHFTGMSLDGQGNVLDCQQWSALSDCPDLDVAQRLVVLVPGEWVLTLKAMLPQMRRSELLKALPYAIEDQLIDEIETFYFTLGGRCGDDQWTIGVVERNRLDTFIQTLKNQHLFPDLILPDYLALDLETETWSVVLDGKVALVRMGREQGFVVDSDNLVSLLQLQLGQHPERRPDCIRFWPVDTEFEVSKLNALQLPVSIQEGKGSSAFDTNQLAADFDFNLLQKQHRTKRRAVSSMRPWRLCGASVLLFLVVFLGGFVAHFFYLKHRLYQLKTEVVSLQKAIFPDVSLDKLSVSRVTAFMHQLKKEQRSEVLLRLLSIFSEVLHRYRGIVVEGLSYEGDVLTLKLKVPTQSKLKGLLHWLESRGLLVGQKVIASDSRVSVIKLQIGRSK